MNNDMDHIKQIKSGEYGDFILPKEIDKLNKQLKRDNRLNKKYSKNTFKNKFLNKAKRKKKPQS